MRDRRDDINVCISTGLVVALLSTLGIRSIRSRSSLTDLFSYLAKIVSGIMSSFLVDRIGRRPLLFYSYLGTGICLVTTGVYFFYLQRVESVGMASYGFIPFVCIICSNVISTLGFVSVITVVPAEIFALNVKAVALTSFSIFAGLLMFIVTRSYQIILDLTGLCGVFWILGCFSISGSIFSFFVVPETRGKSLREIQIMLQGDLYEFDAFTQVSKDPEDNNSIEINELIKKDCDLSK